MLKLTTDTMALILYLENRKMPELAKSFFKKADLGEIQIYIPSMVLAEIGYLEERKKIELSITAVEKHILNKESYSIFPQTLDVLKSTFEIKDVPELHDRIIAGTAKLLGNKLITNDPKIEASIAVETIWK